MQEYQITCHIDCSNNITFEPVGNRVEEMTLHTDEQKIEKVVDEQKEQVNTQNNAEHEQHDNSASDNIDENTLLECIKPMLFFVILFSLMFLCM